MTYVLRIILTETENPQSKASYLYMKSVDVMLLNASVIIATQHV